ncbi:MAG: phage fiber-tail adaptor protein [Planctomycetota bacterium]|jgi:hypothetical protein
MPSIVLKDPDAVLDYKFDWAALTNGTGSTDWLASGETISTKTVTVPAGITKDSDSLADTNTSVLVWLSGGTAGEDYDVVCHITTSDSRQDDRTLTVKVKER